MKSIKEKSEEYVYGFHPSIQRMCNESFEEGANYVLDAITNVINQPMNDYLVLVELRNVIQQLKGNQ